MAPKRPVLSTTPDGDKREAKWFRRGFPFRGGFFLSEKERMLRRERIFARLRAGWAYAEIAQAEGLSSKRISQIVSEALQKRTLDSVPDHAMLQLARLEPALKLAAGALAEGDVGAISPYLKLPPPARPVSEALGGRRRLRRQGAPKTDRQDGPPHRPRPCRKGQEGRKGGEHGNRLGCRRPASAATPRTRRQAKAQASRETMKQL